MTTQKFIGLISGTSVDAVDAALLEVSTRNEVELLYKLALPPPETLRNDLLEVTQSNQSITLERFGVLDQKVALWFADAANQLIEKSGTPRATISAIGSHGQTIFHGPDAEHPFTLQIGDPNQIAALTQLPVVGDIRRADMAVGGQGAPIVPAFHNAIFRSHNENRCILNLGGIANITTLPADTNAAILGFDTGPANGLMDAWIFRHQNQPCDFNGDWAASGELDTDLLQRFLQDPYFKKSPPKSTGREVFNLAWLEDHLSDNSQSSANVQRTLCELSAVSIAEAIKNYSQETQRVLVCGGGAHNHLLMERIAASLPNVVVEPTLAQGFDGDYIEAATIAWLAWCRLNNEAGNIPSVTGAKQPAVLGGLYEPTAN